MKFRDYYTKDGDAITEIRMAYPEKGGWSPVPGGAREAIEELLEMKSTVFVAIGIDYGEGQEVIREWRRRP